MEHMLFRTAQHVDLLVYSDALETDWTVSPYVHDVVRSCLDLRHVDCRAGGFFAAAEVDAAEEAE